MVYLLAIYQKKRPGEGNIIQTLSPVAQSTALSERVENIGERGAYGSEAFNNLESAAYVAAVAVNLLDGGLDFQPLFVYEIFYHSQALHIAGSVEACAAVVAPRPYDAEFAFPESQGALRQFEYPGHLADFIVFFVQFVHKRV